MSYVCPRCMNAKGLWRDIEVDGWEAVGDDLTPKSFKGRGPEREVSWEGARPVGTYGCGECQWEGGKGDLVRLGIDGEPLPEVHPGQGTLA